MTTESLVGGLSEREQRLQEMLTHINDMEATPVRGAIHHYFARPAYAPNYGVEGLLEGKPPYEVLRRVDFAQYESELFEGELTPTGMFRLERRELSEPEPEWYTERQSFLPESLRRSYGMTLLLEDETQGRPATTAVDPLTARYGEPYMYTGLPEARIEVTKVQQILEDGTTRYAYRVGNNDIAVWSFEGEEFATVRRVEEAEPQMAFCISLGYIKQQSTLEETAYALYALRTIALEDGHTPDNLSGGYSQYKKVDEFTPVQWDYGVTV